MVLHDTQGAWQWVNGGTIASATWVGKALAEHLPNDNDANKSFVRNRAWHLLLT